MQTSITYSEQDRGDILTTAFEGGVNYWTQVAQVSRAEDGTIQRVWFVEDDDPQVHCLSVAMDALDRAAERIVNGDVQVGDYIKRYIMDEDIDADAADCIVQVAVLGEIVYG